VIREIGDSLVKRIRGQLVSDWGQMSDCGRMECLLTRKA